MKGDSTDLAPVYITSFVMQSVELIRRGLEELVLPEKVSESDYELLMYKCIYSELVDDRK